MNGINWLNSLSGWVDGQRFGIDEVKRVLNLLGDPQELIPAVHVAGTNGKGSAVIMIAAGLAGTGIKVGAYISPHLMDVTERVIIDGLPVEGRLLDMALLEVREATFQLNLELSYFEAVTCAAFLLFVAAKCDYVVLETGLGGRLDATNVIARSKVSVITSIGLDHRETLGDSLQEIANEKFGIIRAQDRVVIGNLPAEVGINGVESTVLFEQFGRDFGIEEDGRGGIVYWSKKSAALTIKPPFEGKHQHYNMAIALKVLEILSVPQQEALPGILSSFWPGRLERVSCGGRKVLLDGAHNVDGALALKVFLDRSPEQKSICFGVLSSKEWQRMVEILHPCFHSWLLIEPDSKRALPSSILAEYLSGIGVNSIQIGTVNDIKDFAPECELVVAGSLYLIGKARGVLEITDRPYWTRGKNP